MMPPLPALDIDLLIEHDGHELKLTGSGRRFIASFPTLASLIHFSRAFWKARKRIPRDFELQLEWRGLRLQAKR